MNIRGGLEHAHAVARKLYMNHGPIITERCKNIRVHLAVLVMRTGLLFRF